MVAYESGHHGARLSRGTRRRLRRQAATERRPEANCGSG